jgi:hypothetical protein
MMLAIGKAAAVIENENLGHEVSQWFMSAARWRSRKLFMGHVM